MIKSRELLLPLLYIASLPNFLLWLDGSVGVSKFSRTITVLLMELLRAREQLETGIVAQSRYLPLTSKKLGESSCVERIIFFI